MKSSSSSHRTGFTPGYMPKPYYRTSASYSYPSRNYNNNKKVNSNEPQPKVVQTEQTIGQSIKQGFGGYIGYGIAEKIFGWNSDKKFEELEKEPIYIKNTSNDKCEDYKQLLNKCLNNGGDWNGNDCSKFIDLLQKCQEQA
jgi:hypothetical protein